MITPAIVDECMSLVDAADADRLALGDDRRRPSTAAIGAAPRRRPTATPGARASARDRSDEALAAQPGQHRASRSPLDSRSLPWTTMLIHLQHVRLRRSAIDTR